MDRTHPTHRTWRRGLLAAVFTLLPAACGGQSVDAAGTGDTAPPAVVQVAQSGGPSLGGVDGFGKYLAGRLAQEAQDSAAAADYYLKALEADPDNVMLARRAYFFLLAEGRMEEGIRLARRTLDLDPEATVAPLVLATGAAREGDWARALELLERLEPVGLNSFMLPMMKSWALQGLGRTDDALTALAPMGKLAPLQQIHDFHAGLLLDVAGRPDAAWEFYRKTVADQDTLSLRAVQIVADFLRRQGREDEARTLFDDYRAAHPGSMLIEGAFERFGAGAGETRGVTSARDGMAEALYGAASSVVQTQALDTGLVFARMALMLRPDFPYAEMMVGDILHGQQRWDAAATVFAGIGADSPVYFPVRMRLAEDLERLDKPDQAREVLVDLSRRMPEAPEPLVQLGDLERREENWDAAVKAYRGAFDRIDTIEDRHWALYYSLGVALERAKRWDDAEASFKKALELEPDQPLVLNYLGYSWIDRGENLEQGKALIERAVAQRPTDGFIVDSLGWAYYLLGQYRDAVKELERAVELQPADPTINDHLGDALWRVGRRSEARFQWQRALTLDPEPEVAEAIQEKLENGLPEVVTDGGSGN